MQWRSSTLARLAAAAILVGACGGSSVPVSAQASGGAQVGASGDPAGTAAGDAGPAQAAEAPLGTATYTVDATKRVDAAYTPDGEQVTVSADDATGATWTVTVPAGALPRPATIAITPLATIDAKLPGPVLGGVLLEPGGTQFLLPVEVSVTGGRGILQGAADGTVRFAMPGDGGWGTARLWHFSPDFSVDPNEAVWARGARAVAEDTGKAMAEARDLLKSKDFQIPDVPSIAWECRDDSGWKSADAKINAFITAFLNPEDALRQRLLMGARMAQLIGLNTDTAVTGRAADLTQRLGQKAVKLMELTKGQPEKILPVVRAVMVVAHDKELLGAEHQDLLAKLGTWAEASLDPVARAIREEHDYAQAEVAWEIGRTVELLAGTAMVDKVEAKLKGALKFTAELKLALHHPESLGALLEERLGATVPMTYEGAGTGRQLVGTALGDYLSVKGSEDNVAFETPSFPIEASLVSVDFCGGTAIFFVDTFGSPDEAKVYTDTGHKYVYPYAQQAFYSRFDKYFESLPATVARETPLKGVAFLVKLRNRSATWIDQTFDSTDNNDQTGEFEIVLTHTPG